MEFQFDGEPKQGATPGTRVYAPTTGGEDGAPRRRRRKAEPEVTTVIDEDGFRIRVPKDEIKAGSRIGLIFCAFLLAGMVLFILTGYERISRAYADINTLSNEIELTELRIAELDVSIECAVTITQAQEAAKNAGMQYPTQSQYVRIGSAIPVSTQSAGSAPAEADPAATPTEGGTPAETGTPGEAPADPASNG